MVRIGGKEMKYKVLNCPAYNDMPNMYDEIYGYCDNEHDIDLDKCRCENITDCVVKQVIEECDKIIIYTQNAEIDVMLERSGITDAEKSELYGQCKMARKILNLFDIEELHK
jgi:hypothetical protein